MPSYNTALQKGRLLNKWCHIWQMHDRSLKFSAVPLEICKIILPLSNLFLFQQHVPFTMFSSSKKNDDRHNGSQDKKSVSLDALESELTVLNKSELGKVEGGKDAKKPLNDPSGLRNSIGGSIPL